MAVPDACRHALILKLARQCQLHAQAKHTHLHTCLNTCAPTSLNASLHKCTECMSTHMSKHMAVHMPVACLHTCVYAWTRCDSRKLTMPYYSCCDD